jgi:hypothetical protein
MKYGMKGLLGLALTSTLLMSANALAAQPRHLIFLIHGIGGAPDTFYKLPEVLQKNLDSIDRDVLYRERNGVRTKYEVYPLAYQTKEDSQTVYDFAKQIDAQMAEKAGQMQEGDKISIMAHSQGGLVSSVWLFKSAYEELHAEKNPNAPRELHSQLFRYVKNFTTLGTPFWGSRLGNLGAMADNLTSNKLLTGLGEKQLKGMSLEGSGIEFMRLQAIRAQGNGILKKIFNQVKMVNVAGKFLSIKNLQTDGAVSLPSARMDFIHGEIKSGYDSSMIQSPEFHQLFEGFAESPDYVVVDASHTTVLKGQDSRPMRRDWFTNSKMWAKGPASVHQVAMDCADKFDGKSGALKLNPDSGCESPSFVYMFGNLIGYQNKYASAGMKESDTYMIDLSVEAVTKAGSKTRAQIPTSGFRVYILDDAGGKAGRTIVDTLQGAAKRIGPKLASLGEEWGIQFLKDEAAKIEALKESSLSPNKTRIHEIVVGQVPEKFNAALVKEGGYKSRQILLEIEAPGFKSVKTWVTVRPTFTTFLKVNLDQQ